MDTIAIDTKKQARVSKKVSKLKKRMQEGVEIKQNLKREKLQKLPNKLLERGAVYLGHIPHGFFEDEIRSFSNQFGVVTRVRVARSPKTGRSKGYAFVEFLNPEVAKIFAETLHNYLMFDRLLVCQYIEPEKRHPKMFWQSSKGCPGEVPFVDSRRAKDMERKNNPSLTKEEEQKKKNLRKIEDFNEFFRLRGIDFNWKINDPNVDNKANESITEAVLEIDESDDEIEFNAPPGVTKVFKSNKAKKLTPRQANILQAKNEEMVKKQEVQKVEKISMKKRPKKDAPLKKKVVKKLKTVK